MHVDKLAFYIDHDDIIDGRTWTLNRSLACNINWLKTNIFTWYQHQTPVYRQWIIDAHFIIILCDQMWIIGISNTYFLSLIWKFKLYLLEEASWLKALEAAEEGSSLGLGRISLAGVYYRGRFQLSHLSNVRELSCPTYGWNLKQLWHDFLLSSKKYKNIYKHTK